MKFIEFFCGIGGFRLGLERANQESRQSGKRTRSTGCSRPKRDSSSSKRDARQGNKDYYRCVWSNDNDKYACQIYRKRFGEVYEGDIRTVDPFAIPEHDLLTAGFPCQSFSIAGKRGGFEDTRGTLFFEICRIARAKKTKYLFLENVKGLLSHDDGATFQTIIGTLDELGYDCQWQVLNSKDFGVPQNRERVFIIGHLRGQPRPKVFPIGETSGTSLNYRGAIMSEQNQKWLEDGKELSRNFPQGQRVYATDGLASSICGDAGGLGGKTGLYDVYNQQFRANQELAGTLKGEGISETSLGTVLIAQALQTDGQLRQGVSWDTDKPQSARNIRRLTPLECERLQGFPDGWTEGISDTQRYKCLGNAVTVNVIEAIGRQWLKSVI